MDGFEKLSATDMWRDIKAADSALFDVYQSCKRAGFLVAADYAFDARMKLNTAENILRHHFKHDERKEEPRG